jgi:hypothetical protein
MVVKNPQNYLLKKKSAYKYRAAAMADQVKNCKICARRSYCRWHSPKKDAGWTEATVALNAKGIGARVIPGPDAPIGIALTVPPEILGDLDWEKRINSLVVKIVDALARAQKMGLRQREHRRGNSKIRSLSGSCCLCFCVGIFYFFGFSTGDSKREVSTITSKHVSLQQLNFGAN